MRQHLLQFLLFSSLLGEMSLAATVPAAQQNPEDDLERLRTQLNRLGPDAADERQGAVENLLQRLDLAAHAMLQEKLKQDDDEGLRGYILSALARRLTPNSKDRVFGGGDENKEACSAIIRSYVPALAAFWRADSGVAATSAVREQARLCLVRFPVREVEAGLRQMLDPVQPLTDRLAALRVAADCQNIYLARLLADNMDAQVDEVRAAAREGLELLTFVDGGFSTRKQVEDWLEQNKNRRYLDLAEDAARNARSKVGKYLKEYEGRLRQKTVDLVAAMVSRPANTDWAKVQSEVLSNDPPGTTDACLERLLQVQEFADGKDAPSPSRQAFHRALYEKLQATEPGQTRRRALLLETLALLVRRSEPDLGAEIQKQLRAALKAEAPELRLAALRALRHYPKPEARADVVAFARGELASGVPANLNFLKEALKTLGKRPYTAPSEGDVDKADWLLLMRQVLSQPGLEDLRSDALSMCPLADVNGNLLPEVFKTLLELGRDTKLPADCRLLCLIKLKDFAADPVRADEMVRQFVTLLDDQETPIRSFAATELGKLPDDEAQKPRWIELVLEALRRRMRVETEPGVFAALATAASACAAPPGSASKVITCLLPVVDDLGDPVPAGQQFKLDPLLAQLAVQAATPQIPAAAWTAACERLYRHGKRPQLRFVLEQQHAITLADDLNSPDKARADAARQALMLILRTAQLKDAAKTWGELKDEASDVRSAFQALETAKVDLDAPELRLLRLEMLVGSGVNVTNAWTDAIRYADTYLADTDAKVARPLSAAQKDRVRLLAGEAHLALGHKDQAAELLKKCDPTRLAAPEAINLLDRLGKAFAEGTADSDAAKAFDWQERALRLTNRDDKAYRTRLLTWAQTALRIPQGRELVQNRLIEEEPLFRANDCPPELRIQFDKLRNG